MYHGVERDRVKKVEANKQVIVTCLLQELELIKRSMMMDVLLQVRSGAVASAGASAAADKPSIAKVWKFLGL